MAYSFPTLVILPTYPLDETIEDLTIRVGYSAGYDHTRPKFTNAFRKTYTVKYTYMSNTDKSTLDTFITTVDEGLSTFTWTHPQSAAAKIVRFNQLPKFSYVWKNSWDCEFTLQEV